MNATFDVRSDFNIKTEHFWLRWITESIGKSETRDAGVEHVRKIQAAPHWVSREKGKKNESIMLQTAEAGFVSLATLCGKFVLQQNDAGLTAHVQAGMPRSCYEVMTQDVNNHSGPQIGSEYTRDPDVCAIKTPGLSL